MSSLLTNTSAMIALQTLKGVNDSMATTQNRISTGMRVNDASDNAAYWSIATTMKSDNKALGAVEDALGLGAATVDVAFTAIDKAVDVVDEIKAKLVAASEPGVPRAKIQKDISALQEQLKTIAGSATFNGENWLQQDSASENFNAVKEVVGSFTRDSGGNVKLDKIQIDTTDITLIDTDGTAEGILDKDMTAGASTGTFTASVVAVAAVTADPTAVPPVLGVTGVTGVTGVAATFTGGTTFEDKVIATLVAADSTLTTVPAADLDRLGGTSILDFDISKLTDSAGDLAVLSAVIDAVDTQLQGMTDAATSLGSAKSRIDMQTQFVSELGDAIDRGVGQLVDAVRIPGPSGHRFR